MSLVARSLLVLGLLFGLVFAIGAAVLWHYEAPVWFAVIFAVAVVGLQYLIGPYVLQWIFKIRWATPEEVGPEFAAWLEAACGKFGIPMPRLGVIPDGRPNAFTFGHVPGDARLVVTQGLLEMLSPEEVQAVVAHELGHIRNWDFVVMTVASAIPLVLYMLYAFTRDRESRSSGYAWVIGIVSYLAYFLSNYIVLLLSRIREYYADYFSARVTQDPNALASSLVTIAYGLAKAAPKAEPADEKGKKKAKKPMDWVGAVAPLGIASSKAAPAFAAMTTDREGNFSMENMRRAVRWELANPWAKLFELMSTHPLTANRIRALQKLCRLAHVEPKFDLPPVGDIRYGGKFMADILMLSLPYLGLIAGLLAIGQGIVIGSALPPLRLLALVPLLGGVGWFLRLRFEYPDNFEIRQVADLVGETEVSHIRSIPATLEGKIIGRGVPGLFFSEDLVLQDEEGFILLDYRQPLGIWEFLFGWLKADRFIGREAAVRGWYRRAPMPFLEVKELIFDDGQRIKCYHYPFKIGASILLALVGAGLMMLG